MSIEPYEERPVARIDMRNRVTDSWTDILEPVADLATKIASTEFVPQALRGSVPKVAAAILAGREMGIPPMQALAGVHIINGRPGISAELMRALILQAGHELKFIKSTAAQCVMRGRRHGDDDWTEVAYTLQEAKDAGDYTKNPNYRTRPADMLTARATTRLARMIFADIIHGMRSLEELQDMVEGDQPHQLTVEQVETTTVSRQSPRAAAVEGAAPTPSGAAQPEGGAKNLGVGDAPPSPPQRKRAPLKPRQAEPAEDSKTPSEAELQTSKPDDVQRPPITTIEERHHKAVQATVMHFNRLGITDRTDRIHWTSIIAGRTITTTNDLNLSDLRGLIGKLERIKNRQGLIDLMPTDEPEDPGAPPALDAGPATGAATETTAAAPPSLLDEDETR